MKKKLSVQYRREKDGTILAVYVNSNKIINWYEVYDIYEGTTHEVSKDYLLKETNPVKKSDYTELSGILKRNYFDGFVVKFINRLPKI